MKRTLSVPALCEVDGCHLKVPVRSSHQLMSIPRLINICPVIVQIYFSCAHYIIQVILFAP